MKAADSVALRRGKGLSVAGRTAAPPLLKGMATPAPRIPCYGDADGLSEVVCQRCAQHPVHCECDSRHGGTYMASAPAVVSVKAADAWWNDMARVRLCVLPGAKFLLPVRSRAELETVKVISAVMSAEMRQMELARSTQARKRGRGDDGADIAGSGGANDGKVAHTTKSVPPAPVLPIQGRPCVCGHCRAVAAATAALTRGYSGQPLPTVATSLFKKFEDAVQQQPEASRDADADGAVSTPETALAATNSTILLPPVTPTALDSLAATAKQYALDLDAAKLVVDTLQGLHDALACSPERQPSSASNIARPPRDACGPLPRRRSKRRAVGTL